MAFTVKDVAEQAGVSTATVSRVLNKDPRISAATTGRVQKVIEELGYAPNPFARGLKTSRSLTVGFLAPEFTNDFFLGIARGVERRLQEVGLTLIICNSNEDPQTEMDRLGLLLDRGVDGLIVIPTSASGAHFGQAVKLGVPVVLVDRLVDDFHADAVLADNVNGTYQVLEPFLLQGVRRIGFLGGDQRLTSARERYDGFRRLLEDYHVPFDPELVRFGDFHDESGSRLLSQLLELPEPPQLVFISNRFMHLGATRLLLERGLKPDQAPRLVAFDDLDLAASLGYCEAMVRQPVHEIGVQAAEFLISRLSGEGGGEPRLARVKSQVVSCV